MKGCMTIIRPICIKQVRLLMRESNPKRKSICECAQSAKGSFSNRTFCKEKCWLVGFVALRPKSTAMVIAGRSVHLTTLFPG